MGLIGHHGLLRSQGGIIFNDNYALSNGFTTESNDFNFRGSNVKRLNFDPTLYDWSQDFTLEFKYKAGFLYYYPKLFHIGSDSVNTRLNILQFSKTQIIVQARINNVTYLDMRPLASENVEHHFIISLKKNVLGLISVDGVLSSKTLNIDYPTENITRGAFIGGFGETNDYVHNGYQYDCRIYIGKAANDAEMAEMYNGGVRRDATPAMQPYLKSDYRLNQMNGNVAIDRGPLENHGSLVNYTEAETQQGAGFWIAR